MHDVSCDCIFCRYKEAHTVQSEMQPCGLSTAATALIMARIHIEIIDRNRIIRAGVFAEQPEAYQPPLDCLMQALKIYESRLGPKHLDYARACFALGEVYVQQMDHPQAMEFFHRSLVALKSDEVEGLNEERDHDEAQTITSLAAARTMHCQAVLATPQNVLRQLNRRPKVVIAAPSPVVEPFDTEFVDDGQLVKVDDGQNVATTIADFAGVYCFVALHDGWPRFETVDGKQLFHNSEGCWCICQRYDPAIASTPTVMNAPENDQEHAGTQHRQPLYHLSVLAADGLLPEGSCAWQLKRFDWQDGEERKELTTSTSKSTKWWMCVQHKEQLQEEQVLRLAIPAALTQLVVGAHVQVQRHLTRCNQRSHTEGAIAEGTVGLIVEVSLRCHS